MKDILALIPPTTDNDLSIGARYAIELASRHRAHLSTLILALEAAVYPFHPKPDTMPAYENPCKTQSAFERMNFTSDLVLAAAKLANVPCDVLRTEAEFRYLAEQVIRFAQTRDIVVVDTYGVLREPRRTLIDSVLIQSGRPLVLVPQDAHDLASDRILIAWDATRSAVRAVHDAMSLLTRAKTVTIASVIDDTVYSAPEAESGIRCYLARWHIDAKYLTIRRHGRSVGASLLDDALGSDANLLVMGGHAHGFERTLMHGSATKDIFDTALEIPVLLSH